MAATQREQRIARVVDREVAPVWHDRFARLMYRELPRVHGGLVLDVHCATGRTTTELLKRLDGSTRVVGLEPSEPNLALARGRMRPDWKQRVYLKPGDITDVTEMGDDTYDLTTANLVLSEAHDWKTVAAELVRVTKPGGEVLATLPFRGSWAEAEDLLYEVLLHAGLDDSVRRLSRLAQLRPTGDTLASGLEKIGVPKDAIVIEQERFQLLYPSGREFLFSPSVEHGPLRLWKAIIGDSAKPQELFWRLKEAIDAYFGDSVFAVTVVAGLMRVQLPADGVDPLARRYWQRYPNLEAVFQGRFESASTGQDDTEDEEIDLDLDLEIDLDDEDEDTSQAPAAPTPAIKDSDDAAIFAAMGQPESEEEDLEGMLDSMFDAVTTEGDESESSDSPDPVIQETSRQLRSGPRGETTASRLGLKIGSTTPTLPPPPPTGPQKAVPPPSDSSLPGGGKPRK